MKYIKVSQAAEKWGISARRVRSLCAEGKIEGVIRKGNLYMIPADSSKPRDGRFGQNQVENNIYIKNAIDSISDNGGLNQLSKNIQELDNIKATIISPQLQELAVSMQKMNSAIISVFQSEAMQAVLAFGQKIAEAVKAIDFTPILKNFSEAIVPIAYIGLLEKLKWPIFLIQDEKLRGDIMNACREGEDLEKVNSLIFKYCNSSFLENMKLDWNNCVVILNDRKSILSEALLMHEQGYYYASTSILMCQVYGIAADIDGMLKKNGLYLDKREKEYVAELYNMDKRYIDNEKGKLFQTLMFTESGMLLWDAMAHYLKDVCLFSGSDYSDIDNQPLRNKICHGDQLTYGTKEHSLKSILVVDMLIQLSYEIDRIIKMKNNIVELEKNG